MPKTQIKLKPTRCPLCHRTDDYTVLYPQNFTLSDITTEVFSARRLPDKLHYQLVQCKHDGMVRSHPILDMNVLSKLYKDSKFTYHGEVNNLTKTYVAALEPILQQLQKKDTLVEVGCGNGFMIEALLRKGFTNVMGVEPSIDAIKQAPKGIQKRIKNSIFKRTLFATKSVACIFIFQTLDHIPQPDAFIKDCFTVLKPGGYFLSFHHNVESLTAKVLGEKSPIFDVEHTQLFSLKTSAALLKNQGFEVVSVISPTSFVSLKHLLWLFPLPRSIKASLLTKPSALTNLLSRVTVPVKLGNVCVIGRKPL